MKDSQIVELYWNRDERAIRETSTRYGRYCYAIADNILHDPEDAEECVNDTWMRAWNAMPQRPGRLRMFLAKITRNLSFDRFQARRAQKRGGGGNAAGFGGAGGMPAQPGRRGGRGAGRELERAVSEFLRVLPSGNAACFCGGISLWSRFPRSGGATA